MRIQGILAITLALCLSFTAAQASVTTTIPGYADLTYTSKVKLKPTGCQIIEFTYLTDDALSMENTIFLVQIIALKKKIIYGGSAWFSKQTWKGDALVQSLTRAGVMQAKICRKSWVEITSSVKTRNPGIGPGTYRLYFAGATLNPTTGKLMGSKREIFKTIVFY
ncbi:MAG: hypothetical protein WCO95_01455 [Actinomycetes bacterium]